MRAYDVGVLSALVFAVGCAPDLTLGGAGGGGKSTASTTSATGGTGGQSSTSSTSSMSGQGGTAGGSMTGTPLFAAGYGDAADQSVHAVAVAPDGSVVIAGKFAGSMDVGTGAVTSMGGDDAFVAGLDADGKGTFLVRMGDAAPQRALAVAAGPNGRVAVAGEYAGTLAPGVVSAGGMDGFVAVLENGTPVWVKGFGDAGYQSITGVAFDGAGNVVVVGSFSGNIDFGGEPLASAGGYDGFVAKLDADGNRVWSMQFGDDRDQRARCVAVGPNGDVHVGGDMMGSVDLGGGAVTSAGDTDVLVVKLAADGKLGWVKRYGDTGAQSVRGIAVGSDGNMVVVGETAGVLDFGGGAVAMGTEGALFAAKLDMAGQHMWSKGFARVGGASVNGVAVDGSGAVVLVGDVTGSVDFGGGAVMSMGAEDMFVARLDAAGKYGWALRFGDAEGQRAAGVGVNLTGEAWVGGWFGGNMDVGGTMVGSAGGVDGFVVEVAP